MAKLKPVPLTKKSKLMPILVGRGPRKINGKKKKLSQDDINNAKSVFLNQGGVITTLPSQIVLVRSPASLSAKRLGTPRVEAID